MVVELDTARKIRAVSDLLVQIFSVDELWRFIVCNYDDEIASQISWRQSRATVAVETVRLLKRNGRLNEHFFTLLRQVRRCSVVDIDKVEKFVSTRPVASSSGYLLKVSSTETERAAVCWFVEIMCYIFHVFAAGTMLFKHDLDVVEGLFLAGVSCLVLVGGVFVSYARARLQLRASVFLHHALGGPVLSTSVRPGKDLLARDGFRYLEYVVMCGMLFVAPCTAYDLLTTCCPLPVLAIRAGVGTVMLLLGLVAIRAARRPLLTYAQYLVEVCCKRAQNSVLKKVGTASFLAAAMVCATGQPMVSNSDGVGQEASSGGMYADALPLSGQINKSSPLIAIHPTRFTSRGPSAREARAAELLTLAQHMLSEGRPEAAYQLGQESCLRHPTAEAYEVLVTAVCAMADRRLAKTLVDIAPRDQRHRVQECLGGTEVTQPGEAPSSLLECPSSPAS